MMTRFCGIHFSYNLCKKNSCKSFNKIDFSWLFTCIRVTVNLTNQPRPGECTFKTSELCELTIQPHCLRLPTVHELLYFQPEKCTVQFYYQAQIHVYTYLIFSRRFLCWRFLHLFIWTLCIRFICCRLLVSKKHVLSPFTIIIIIITITTVFSSSSSSVIIHVATLQFATFPFGSRGKRLTSDNV